MNSDGVIVSFDAILRELEDVILDVNSQGAECFQKGDYDQASKLVDDGKKLGEFKRKLNTLRDEWINRFDVETRRRVRIVTPRTFRPHQKGSPTHLRVTFSNGKEIEQPVAAETFAIAIQELGIENVLSLGKKLYGFPLVSTQKNDKYGQHRVGSYFIITHSNTETKKKQLEEIARDLGVRIQVQIMQRDR